MKQLVYLLISIAILLFSCKKKAYTINDFDRELQIKLKTLENKNVLATCTGGLLEQFENLNLQTIIKLTKSNKPIFRGLGAHLYVNRKEFEINEYFYELLKDTGTLTLEYCSCGFCGPSTYSSNVAEVAAKLNKSYWRNIDYKGRHNYIRRLIRDHQDIEDTYDYISWLNKEELKGLESSIRKIIFSNRKFVFKEIALVALAKCSQKEDFKLIQDSLISNLDSLSRNTFDFLEVFEAKEYDVFFEAVFNKMISKDRHITKKYYRSFLQSLKEFKNEKRQRFFIALWNDVSKMEDKEKRLQFQEDFLIDYNSYRGKSYKKDSTIFYKKFLRSKEVIFCKKLIEDKRRIEELQSFIDYENKTGIYAIGKVNSSDAPPPPLPPDFTDNLDVNLHTQEGLTKIKKLYKQYLKVSKNL